MTTFNLEEFLKASDEVIKGKRDKSFLALCNLISFGHTLIEDSPGVGKTTLVKFFANTFDLDMSRIQFTNDLLPGDVLGNHIFNKETQSFEFYQGPVFGEIVLADELNRAPSKTQSALLQAMEEKKISLDGNTYSLPEPFIVFATQNPHGQFGTFELPESQLDRFSIKMNIGYADKSSTINLLKQESDLASHSKFKLNRQVLFELNEKSQKVFLSDEVYDYIYRLLNYTRDSGLTLPLSNRAGLDIVRISKSYALLKERDYVTPDDVSFLFPYCAGHRLVRGRHTSIEQEHELAHKILNEVPMR